MNDYTQTLGADIYLVIPLHYMKRMKQRAGLNKSAAARMARRVLEEGETSDDHTDSVIAFHLASRTDQQGGAIAVAYGEFVHIFVFNQVAREVVAVTVYPLSVPERQSLRRNINHQLVPKFALPLAS